MGFTIVRGNGVVTRATLKETAIERASTGEKTAITFSSHEIGLQLEADLRRKGVPVRYRMSPHTYREPRGRPLCRFVEEGRFIASAGMSVGRELCQGLAGDMGGGRAPCPYLNGCEAAAGVRSDPNPLVWLGHHLLVREAHEFVKRNYGLLIVDSPPDLYDIAIVGDTELAEARRAARILDGSGQIEMLLDALQGGLRDGATGDAWQVLRVGVNTIKWVKDQSPMYRLQLGLTDSGALDHELREQIAHFVPKGSTRLARPTLLALRERRGDPSLAPGCKVIQAIALAINEKASLSVKSLVVEGKLVVGRPAEDLRRAILRVGDTLIIDRKTDSSVWRKFVGDTYEQLYKQEMEVVDVAVEDGAPIERVRLHCASANKRRWFPGGRLLPDHFVGPLRAALELACQDPARKEMLIVARPPVVSTLRLAWLAEPATPEATLCGVRKELEPWRQRGGRLHFSTYGKSEHLCDMDSIDVLLALGDPWTDRTKHAGMAELLGAEFKASYEGVCRAELAEAVSGMGGPLRTRPGMIIVVSTQDPLDWDAGNARVVGLRRGRPRSRADGLAGRSGDDLRAEREAAGISRREHAERLGVPETTLRRAEGR